MKDKIPVEFWQWAWRQVKLERKETGNPANCTRIAFAASLTAEIWSVIRKYRDAGN
jgi:hypothetical protein